MNYKYAGFKDRMEHIGIQHPGVIRRLYKQADPSWYERLSTTLGDDDRANAAIGAGLGGIVGGIGWGLPGILGGAVAGGGAGYLGGKHINEWWNKKKVGGGGGNTNTLPPSVKQPGIIQQEVDNIQKDRATEQKRKDKESLHQQVENSYIEEPKQQAAYMAPVKTPPKWYTDKQQSLTDVGQAQINKAPGNYLENAVGTMALRQQYSNMNTGASDTVDEVKNRMWQQYKHDHPFYDENTKAPELTTNPDKARLQDEMYTSLRSQKYSPDNAKAIATGAGTYVEPKQKPDPVNSANTQLANTKSVPVAQTQSTDNTTMTIEEQQRFNKSFANNEEKIGILKRFRQLMPDMSLSKLMDIAQEHYSSTTNKKD